jgi:hypothetical protein
MTLLNVQSCMELQPGTEVGLPETSTVSILLLVQCDPLLGEITSSWGHSQAQRQREWCAHWSMLGSAMGRFQETIKISKCLFRLDHCRPTPSCAIPQNNDCT